MEVESDRKVRESIAGRPVPVCHWHSDIIPSARRVHGILVPAKRIRWTTGLARSGMIARKPRSDLPVQRMVVVYRSLRPPPNWQAGATTKTGRGDSGTA